jgi:LmbE family N-acetylglucosaminyl deacetylase
MVRTLSQLFEKERPDVVFAPHAEDQNATHVGTHHLVADAVRKYLGQSRPAPLPFIETEYWRQQASPNLMVGISTRDEATLVMAAAAHGGEVRRNPYHLRHPGRMMDNVRRGAEIVGLAGIPAPDFPFAELHRFTFLSAKGWVGPRQSGCIIGPDEKLDWRRLVAHFAVKA